MKTTKNTMFETLGAGLKLAFDSTWVCLFGYTSINGYFFCNREHDDSPMAFGVFGAGPTQSFIIGYMLNIGVQ